jgi:hypothetical protein
LIVLFVSGAIIIGTLWLYRTTLLTALLRSLAIIVFYLIITGFTLPLRTILPQRPPLVLIDASASMASHMDSVHALCAILQYEHSSQYFVEDRIVNAHDSIRQYGAYTDIIGGLGSVRDNNPSAVLLVSDGNHNYQGSTLSGIDDYPVPVYTFGVGIVETRDIALIEVLHPDYVYLNDSFEIEVTVQSHGYAEGNGVVELSFDHSKKTLKRSFPLSNVKAKNTVAFRTDITQTADTLLTVSILPAPGEAHTENNTQHISFTLIEQKIKAVYFTDHMSFNTKFILPALVQDPRLEITAVVRNRGNQYIDPATGEQRILPLIDTMNVLIVDNISCSTLPWPGIEKAVQSGLGVLCFGTIQQITPEWQSMLPITIAEAVTETSTPVTVREGFSCLVLDRSYSPFSYMQRVLGSKDHAVTIAETNNVPVIAYQRYGQGTVFQINCTAIGSWHLVQKGMLQQNIVSCLFPDIIRFIAPVGRNKRLVLASLPRTAMIGERIDFMLKSYDSDFRVSGGGDFTITVYDRTLPFYEIRKGIYHTSVIAQDTAHITVTAKGFLNDESLTSNTIPLRVHTGTRERTHALNERFLEEVAHRTGGSHYALADLAAFSVPDAAPRYRVQRIHLNHPLGYLLVLVLMAFDWILRRRRGSV